jgi:tRNA-modifying protein YgfZ
MTVATWLDDRGVLSVSGEDATTFLQGLLTNDVERLEIGQARYAALLTPQGKILFDFFIYRAPAESGASYLIDCVKGAAPDLAKRLGFYRLRAKVMIADLSAERAVVAFWGDDPPNAAGFLFADPRDSGLGWRAIVRRDEAAAVAMAPTADYEARRIEAGVPRGGADFHYGDAFPHDANMDVLNGVDFEKGCYVGQEVVSRMRHRGGVRKRIVKVTLQGPAPAAGSPILAGDLTIGALGSSAANRGLALVRVDRLAEAAAQNKALIAAGVSLSVDEKQA